MTTKDFELIAKVIKELRPTMEEWGHVASFHLLVNQMNETLAGTNPRFNEDLFLTACGVK